MIKDKVFGENVGVTQALEHSIHKACVAMVAEPNHARCRVGWPHVRVYRWYAIVFGIVGLGMRGEMLFQVHASEDADGRRLNSQPADKISYSSSPLYFFPSNVVCIYDTVSQTRRAFKVENLNANITSSFGINQASTSLKYPHQNGNLQCVGRNRR